MSGPAWGSARSGTTPPVACRAALGVGVALLALHGLTVGISTTRGAPAAAAECLRLRLDPDTATRAELMLLPRIGPALADGIIEYRESTRPGRAFRRTEDLANVHRIGPATVAQLRPFLRFPPTDADQVDAEASLP